MKFKEGDRIKSNLTRKEYRVKLIRERMVVLETEDKSSQVLTTKDNLRLFYEKIENEYGCQKCSSPLPITCRQ